MPDPTWRLATRKARSGSSSSSSSESESDESLSSSDEDANLHFFGAGRTIQADEPRRVARARRGTLDALLAVFSIIASTCASPPKSVRTPTTREQRNVRWRRMNACVHEPWSSLERSLGELSLALRDKRVQDVREIMAGLSGLLLFSTAAIINKAEEQLCWST